MGNANCQTPCVSKGAAAEYEVLDLHVRAESVEPGASDQPPVVIASPALEAVATPLRKLVGSEEGTGPVISWDSFKSGDPNTRFNFSRVVGRRVVLLFDTVDQGRLFEQLSLVQALQGFPVPDGDDAATKWKTYAQSGKYAWGRAAKVTVVIPWYRPCQMERVSRWHLKGDDTWTNAEAEGKWLDVPTAMTLARLIAAPPPPPPGKGPSSAVDGMPLKPLWCPPLELLFLELHEEAPVQLATKGLSCKVKAERFVPFFLNKFKSENSYKGKDSTYVLFPDHGAFDRYSASVVECLGLAMDHILWIKKTRVGGAVEQVQKLFFDQGKGEADPGEKKSFASTDHVCVIDDFTNSGSTLFGAVSLVRSLAEGSGTDLAVSIFVSHLVAAYDEKVVKGLKDKLHACGPKCRFYTTNTIPLTTDLLLEEEQVEVLSIVDFLASSIR